MNRAAWLMILATGIALSGVAQGSEPPVPPAVVLDPIVVIGGPQPVPRVRLNPPYPMEAKKRWEEGCVVLQFTVRPDGKTDNFTILESNPRGLFEKSVIAAVYQWQYDRSKESRTVVEAFKFHNHSLRSHPLYTVRNAVKVPIGYSSTGGLRYNLEMQLQGYSPPKCKQG